MSMEPQQQAIEAPVAFSTFQFQVLEMVARGLPLSSTLERLCEGGQSLWAGSVWMVIVEDEAGQRRTVAPNSDQGDIDGLQSLLAAATAASGHSCTSAPTVMDTPQTGRLDRGWILCLADDAGDALGHLLIGHRGAAGPGGQLPDWVPESARLAGIAIARDQCDRPCRISHALLAASREIIFLVNGDYQVLAANAAFAAAMNLDPADVAGRRLPELTGEDFFTHELRPILDQALEGTCVSAKLDALIPAFGRRVVELEITPQSEESDGARNAILVVRDVTEQHLANESLRQSEQKYRSFLEIASEFVWEMDPDGRFIAVSSSTDRILGYSPEELIGKSFLDFMAESTLDNSRGTFADLRDNPRPLRNHFNMMRHRNGSLVRLEASIDPVLAPDGTLLGFRGVERDLTEGENMRRMITGAERLAGLGAWELDMESGEFSWTEQVYHLYRLVPGTPVSPVQALQYFAKSSRRAILADFKRSVQTGRPWEGEYESGDAEGRRFWVSITGEPQVWADKVYRITGAIQDITDRREADRALRESEARNRALVESAPEAIIVIDLQRGCLVDANDKAESLFYRSRTELMNVDPDSLFRASTAGRGFMERARHSPDAVFELFLASDLETDIECEIRLSPLSIRNRSLVRASIIDITARKQALQLRRRLMQIIDATPDFIGTCDRFGNITSINQAGCRMLGIENDQALIGQQITVGHPPEDAALITEIGLRVAKKTGSWSADTRLKRTDGELLPVSQVLLAHYREDGEVEYFSTIIRDLSERKSVEAKLKEYTTSLESLSQRLLETRENEQRHIARELHDEIGQSLTALKINLHTAERSTDRALRARLFGDCAVIVDGLVQQVRNLSLDLRPSALDDLGLEAALRSHVERQAQRSNLEIRCHLDTAQRRFPPEIETACFRIAQEALNNVLRHAGASRAEINLSVGGQSMELSITDDGKGFVVPEAADSINRELSFGLAGMHERAMLLGGTLKITSSPGGGSRVHAVLPLTIREPRVPVGL